MKLRMRMMMLVILAVAAVLTGCNAGTAMPSVSGATVLELTGEVANAMAWSEAEIAALDTMASEITTKAGEVETYTGVPLTTLLALAEPQDAAANVVFVAADGYTAEATLAEVLACPECIVAIEDGSLRMVMPGFSGKLQVRDVVEIQVQ